MNGNKTRYAIVVDSEGNKRESVLVETVETPMLDVEGKTTGDYDVKDVPHCYTLRDGERLIYDDVTSAIAMKKPRWTGTGWEETATPEELEAALPPLEDIRAAKLAKISAACEAAIYSGVDVQTTFGVKHFSLTINDQTNIGNLAMQAQAGTTVLYHVDGELCRPFYPDEMLAIATAAVTHKTYHTTYCNHLNVWVRRAVTREELASIYYGCQLPGDLADSLKDLLEPAADNA